MKSKNLENTGLIKDTPTAHKLYIIPPVVESLGRILVVRIIEDPLPSPPKKRLVQFHVAYETDAGNEWLITPVFILMSPFAYKQALLKELSPSDLQRQITSRDLMLQPTAVVSRIHEAD